MQWLGTVLHTLFVERSSAGVALTVIGTAGLVVWMRLLRRPGKSSDALNLLAGLAFWDFLAMPLTRAVWTLERLVDPAPNTVYPPLFSEPAVLRGTSFCMSAVVAGALLGGARLPESLFPLRGKWLRCFLATATLILLAWAGDGAMVTLRLLQSIVHALSVIPSHETITHGWVSITILIAAAPIAIGGTSRLWALMSQVGSSGRERLWPVCGPVARHFTRHRTAPRRLRSRAAKCPTANATEPTGRGRR